ncbi:MAG: AbrB/MazE/SpoVT family DNA-binding domain-containing protein [Candidatus Bathyarchaeota archaeon]|nr:AbrB/MazE/SpoVT family DNA-binding domain-containing protein [Candidatus Bathyarchaeota archaeon]
MVESRVGSKGELFPPKEIREKLGLRAHEKVVYKVEDGRLVVEVVPKLEDVLKEPSSVEITLEEFHCFRRELSRKAEA